jgi:hypothetical protein
MQLGLTSASPTGALYTSTTTAANIGYPFNLHSIGKVVGSSLGDQSYPFFYNWQIEVTPQSCNLGVRKSVTAKVVPKPQLNIEGLQPVYMHTQNGVPVILTPTGGTLTASGMIGNTFYPKMAGVGIHEFIYRYNYGNCINEVRDTVNVEFDNAKMQDGFSIQLWDNPGKKQKLYLVTTQASVVEARILSSTGQKVQQLNFNANMGSNVFDLDFSNLSRGLYFIEVRLKVNNAKKVIKLLN